MSSKELLEEINALLFQNNQKFLKQFKEIYDVELKTSNKIIIVKNDAKGNYRITFFTPVNREEEVPKFYEELHTNQYLKIIYEKEVNSSKDKNWEDMKQFLIRKNISSGKWFYLESTDGEAFCETVDDHLTS